MTNATVGAGLIHFALRRSDNIHWQALDVTKEARAAIKGHRPGVVWFTGLSGAGKSTIANPLEKRLHAMGCHTLRSTATTCGTGSTATSASPTPTGSRTSAAWPRSPG